MEEATRDRSVLSPLFFLLRHGHSIANEQRLIASSPANAGQAFGLTALGEAQVRDNVTRARSDRAFEPPCIIISSPLLRAKESAGVAAEILGVPVTVDARLTERGFGDFELAPDERYERVWAKDRLDPAHRTWGVESVEDVLARAWPLVAEWAGGRARNGAGTVVLCTHGDVASTLLCGALGLPLSRHREVGALQTGALRALVSVDGPDHADAG